MDPYIVLAKEIQGGTFSALRRQNVLTQEEMAERLHISCRAYSDLERRKSCASGVTVLFAASMMGLKELHAPVRRFIEGVRAIEQGER